VKLSTVSRHRHQLRTVHTATENVSISSSVETEHNPFKLIPKPQYLRNNFRRRFDRSGRRNIAEKLWPNTEDVLRLIWTVLTTYLCFYNQWISESRPLAYLPLRNTYAYLPLSAFYNITMGKMRGRTPFSLFPFPPSHALFSYVNFIFPVLPAPPVGNWGAP